MGLISAIKSLWNPAPKRSRRPDYWDLITAENEGRVKLAFFDCVATRSLLQWSGLDPDNSSGLAVTMGFGPTRYVYYQPKDFQFHN